MWWNPPKSTSTLLEQEKTQKYTHPAESLYSTSLDDFSKHCKFSQFHSLLPQKAQITVMIAAVNCSPSTQIHNRSHHGELAAVNCSPSTQIHQQVTSRGACSCTFWNVFDLWRAGAGFHFSLQRKLRVCDGLLGVVDLVHQSDLLAAFLHFLYWRPRHVVLQAEGADECVWTGGTPFLWKTWTNQLHRKLTFCLDSKSKKLTTYSFSRAPRRGSEGKNNDNHLWLLQMVYINLS